MSQLDPIVNLSFHYKTGLVVKNNATTPNTKVDVSLGQARDVSNTIDMVLSAGVTINAAVNGINGLDTGSLAASTVYEVFLIADSSNKNPTGCLMAVNSLTTPPVLPFGYDSYLGIGYAVTDASSHFLLAYSNGSGIANGNTFMFDAPQATAITAGAATSYTAVDLSTIVPTYHSGQNSKLVIIKSVFTPNAASDKLFLQPANGTGDMIVVNAQVAAVPVITYSVLPATYTSSVMSIKYKVSTASAAVALTVAGFVF